MFLHKPSYNFFQFGAQLFPEWYCEILNLPLKTLAQRVRACKSRMPDSRSFWQTRFFLKPYLSAAAPTLEQSLEHLFLTGVLCQRKREEVHKHDHHNSAVLWEDALGPGGFHAASAGAVEAAMRPRIKEQRRYISTCEAGDIMELPWIFNDASWLASSVTEQDLSGASGRTAAGAHLAVVSCCTGAAPSVWKSCMHEYAAMVQQMLNVMMFGECPTDDAFNSEWSDVDWSDWLHPCVNPFDAHAPREAHFFHAYFSQTCAEDSFHESWTLQILRSAQARLARMKSCPTPTYNTDEVDSAASYHEASQKRLLRSARAAQHNRVRELAMSRNTCCGISCNQHPSCVAFWSLQSATWADLRTAHLDADDMPQANAHIIAHHIMQKQRDVVCVRLFGFVPLCRRSPDEVHHVAATHSFHRADHALGDPFGQDHLRQQLKTRFRHSAHAAMIPRCNFSSLDHGTEWSDHEEEIEAGARDVNVEFPTSALRDMLLKSGECGDDESEFELECTSSHASGSECGSESEGNCVQIASGQSTL